ALDIWTERALCAQEEYPGMHAGWREESRQTAVEDRAPLMRLTQSLSALMDLASKDADKPTPKA
ncbi:hypothetical protein LPJ61_007073, partial [Coemansia biformis]